jgi:mannosyltransferase
MASTSLASPRRYEPVHLIQRPTPRQRTDIWIVLAPAVLALFLSVLSSWRPSYWLDETVTVASTVEPVSEIGSVLRHTDSVHGLYYLLMHPWAQVSVAEWWMRLPSALAVTGTAALVALLGWQLGGRRVGILAGCVFALLPISSSYGMEARGYALSMMFSAAAAVSLVQAARGGRRRWWIAYTACVVVSAWVFLFSVLILTGHAGYVLGARRRTVAGLLGRWIRCVAVALILIAPLAVLADGQAGQVSWVQRPTLRGSIDLWRTLWFSYSTKLALVMWLLVLIAVGGGLIPRLRRTIAGRDLVVLGLGTAGLPPVVMLVVSQVHPIFVARYALDSIVPLSLLAGYGLARIPLRGAGAIGLVLVMLTGLGAQNFQRRIDGKGDVISALAAVVEQQRRPGDALMVMPEWYRSAAVAYPAAFGGMADLGLSSSFDLSRRLNPVQASAATMSARLRAIPRVWVLRQNIPLGPGSPGYTVVEEEQAALRAAGFTATATYPGERTELILMTRR